MPFWQKLKKSGASIAAVAMDKSPVFTASDTEHLPTATIIFDHFHLIKLFNKVFMPFGMDMIAASSGAVNSRLCIIETTG